MGEASNGLITVPDAGTVSQLAAPERRINPIAVAEQAFREMTSTTNPAEIRQVEAKLDAVERLMRDTGLYPLDEIRPINEMRMRARWCLLVCIFTTHAHTRLRVHWAPGIPHALLM
jgi:hypothetical protein